METENKSQDSELWIGLKSYEEKDCDKFFGREEETQTLANEILHNVQTVVYGASGTGKSSLIQAGVFRIVRGSRMLPVYIRLKHGIGDYVEQVITVIEEEAKSRNIDIEKTLPYINVVDGKETCQSLWEYFRCNEFWNSENFPVTPLIVFDQFEEIFTLCKDRVQQDSFFEQLADLCDNKYPKYIRDYINDRNNEHIEYPDDLNYRLVLSLREDFLAKLEEKAENIPALKRNRYGVHCTNEEQALDIITKPAPNLVSEDVAIRIIEKVTDKVYGKDFKLHDGPDIEVEPSILSVFCRELDIKRLVSGMDVISSELIDEFGSHILKDFYLNSIAGLSEEKVDFLEKHLLTGNGFRDAVTVFDAKQFGFTDEEIKDLIDKRIVRLEEWDGALRLELTHDVLCKEASEHRNAREKLRQDKKQEEERLEFLRERQRQRRKLKRVIAGSAAVVALIVASWFFWAYMTMWEYAECYASFVRENGWPVGVGKPLSKAEMEERTVYYRLSREGRSGSTPFHRVDVCSGRGLVMPDFVTPIVGNNEEKDEKAVQFAALKAKTCYILFTGMGSKKTEGVSKETYYAKNGKSLYSISYFHANKDVVENDGVHQHDEHNDYVWALFCDASGMAMEVRDNGADRMRILVDSDGHESMYAFYNSARSPRENYVGAYGFKATYNAENRIDTLRHLNQFGEVTRVEVRIYDERKHMVSHNFFDAACSSNALFMDKYARIERKFDKHGDNVECRYFSEDGKLLGRGKVAIEERQYDSHGRIEEINYKDSDGNKIMQRGSDDNYTCIQFFYANDTTGTPYKECRYLGGNKKYLSETTETDVIEEDVYRGTYRHEQISKLSNGIVKRIFLNKENKPVRDSLAQYCAKEIQESQTGDMKCFVTKTFDENNTPLNIIKDRRAFATDSSFYNKEGNLVKQFRFNAAGEAVMAMGYEYEDGLERCRYALSLDGETPIRCPHLEIDSMCYYQLKEASNSTPFGLAFVEAISEYRGCDSYIETGKVGGYHFNAEQETEMGAGWKIQNRDRVTFSALPDSTHRVVYLHITDLRGNAYESGVRDGDLLISCGIWYYSASVSAASVSSIFMEDTPQRIRVLRYDRDEKKWRHLSFLLPAKDKGVDAYLVHYTVEEYKFFQQGMRTFK